MKKNLHEVDPYSNIIETTIVTMDQKVDFHKEKIYRLYPTEPEDENAHYIDMFMVAGKNPIAFCCFSKKQLAEQASKVTKHKNTKKLNRIVNDRWEDYFARRKEMNKLEQEVDETISLANYGEDDRWMIPCFANKTYRDLIDDFYYIQRHLLAEGENQYF